MAYVSIPTRTSSDTAVPYADTNQLMTNFKTFISGVIVNTDFYVDTTTHRVGIGITSPTESFVVGSSSTERFTVAAATGNIYIGGNIGIGTATFASSATQSLAIKNGTAPNAHLDDTVHIFSKDASSGGATLGLFTECAVESIGTFVESHKLKVWINGTEYYISLDAV